MKKIKVPTIRNILYNSYINKDNPKDDINLLKSLVKESNFWNLLKKNDYILSDSFVESILEKLTFYITVDSTYLLISNNNYWEKYYGRMHKISGDKVLKIYGLSVIDECTEKCVAKIG